MKKSDFKLMIRKMVREEVAMTIQEVITELKQPSVPSLSSNQQTGYISSIKVCNGS